MNTHLQTSGNKVFTHLQYAFLYFGRISSIYNILFETVVIDFFCFIFISKHQKSLVMLPENIINIDTYQYLDF